MKFLVIHHLLLVTPITCPVPPLKCRMCNPSVFSTLRNDPFPLILRLKNTPIFIKTLTFSGWKLTLFSEITDLEKNHFSFKGLSMKQNSIDCIWVKCPSKLSTTINYVELKMYLTIVPIPPHELLTFIFANIWS